MNVRGRTLWLGCKLFARTGVDSSITRLPIGCDWKTSPSCVNINETPASVRFELQVNPFDVCRNTKIASVLTTVMVRIYRIVKDTKMESESQVVQQWKASPL